MPAIDCGTRGLPVAAEMTFFKGKALVPEQLGVDMVDRSLVSRGCAVVLCRFPCSQIFGDDTQFACITATFNIG